MARAEDLMARLDERVRSSPFGKGYCERNHFDDAIAALWLQGELVHLEDIVLHDAMMDVRSPTHELTLAHAVLRTRRRIARADPGWATTTNGLETLMGRDEHAAAKTGQNVSGSNSDGTSTNPEAEHILDKPAVHIYGIDDQLSRQLAEMEATITRSSRILSANSENTGSDFTEFANPDAGEAIAAWTGVLEKLRGEGFPPVLLAALAWDAWHEFINLETQHWLGNLLVADLLRSEKKAEAHLPAVNAGLRSVPREMRRSRNRTTRLNAILDGLIRASDIGLKQMDKLALALARMEHLAAGRRKNSHIPELIRLVLSRPMVSTGMISRELGVTQRAALNLVQELGIREFTGRGRFRAWGIL